MKNGERLAKRMARAGISSRRESEKLILQGLVKVNGVVVNTPAFNVTDSDVVEVAGNKAEKAETRMWLYHKPRGLVTSHSDDRGRATVFDMMPEGMPRVISVGRLDLNSEGLLLLTNDGSVARMLELPSNAWARTYRVRTFGTPDSNLLERLRKGVTIESIKYKGIEVQVDSSTTSNAWLLVTLREGKNREIRKIFEHFGHKVSRLIRVGYGPFELGKLEVGAVKEVPARMVEKMLKAKA